MIDESRGPGVLTGHSDGHAISADEVPINEKSPVEVDSSPPTPTAAKAAPRRGTKKTATKSAARRSTAKSSSRKGVSPRKAAKSTGTPPPQAKFPRHSLERSLRVPKVILEQNAGHPCTPAEAARYLGIGNSGPFGVEISSGKKYGLLESASGKIGITERAKRVLRPQAETDELAALREAILEAPDISAVYNHYRGEHLPDETFFNNALVETFKIPADKVSDFRDVFIESLEKAQLIDHSGDRPKLIDIGRENGTRVTGAARPTVRKVGSATTSINASCFVMQPFAPPYGGYYDALFKPAIEQAGLRPIRADDEIFGAGKIMDQVWRGIQEAEVLVAELTTRNANVYYELGLAHALGKPVVLIAAEGENVPFDLQHIRVIYYDTADPFWGTKIIDKIAENIRSALANPEEAVLSIR